MRRTTKLLLTLILLVTAIHHAMANNPLPPHITMVTTDSVSQRAVIKWEPSTSPGIAHYLLYRYNGTNDNYPDSVDILPATARQTEFYKSTAASEVERYALRAIDSLGNMSPFDGVDAVIQQTIHLQSVRDTCSGEVSLNWNKYPALANQINEFKLYSLQTDKWVIIKTLANTEFSYKSNEAFSGNDEFLLEAFGNNLRIYSNHSKAPLPGKSFLQLDSAFAEYTSTGCAISSRIKGGNGNDTLIITRSANCKNTGTQIIKERPVNQQQGEWTDNKASVVSGQTYQLEIHNHCGKTIQSICVKPLGLFYKQENEKFIFNWTSIENSTSYKLEKIENDQAEFSTTTGDTTFAYSPNNLAITDNAKFCFRVTATLNNFRQSTISNILCFSPEPIIKIPELFTPDGNGKNDYFRPIFLFTEPTSFVFTIYDKLGRSIYKSTNYDNKGWDGSLKSSGKALSGDVFIYTLEFTLKDGKHHIKRGNVAIYLP